MQNKLKSRGKTEDEEVRTTYRDKPVGKKPRKDGPVKTFGKFVEADNEGVFDP